jgi:hypothetical protein
MAGLSIAAAPDAVFTVRACGTRYLQGPAISVQVQLPRTRNVQVTPSSQSRAQNREPTQI